jgi:UDP-2,4-diacetamido-2,4,6-trideoxy-beta-L-altropyranose hydrolase
MKVLFRVDASVQIGTGHLARCLTLANMLQQSGTSSSFLCRSPAPALAAQIKSQGHALLTLPPPIQAMILEESDLTHTPWLGVSQQQDAAESLAALRQRFDLLVVDHYGIDQRWEHNMRDAADAIMVIDDLADREHDCEILLDQNLHGAEGNRYSSLVPPHCQTLLGTAYALLRPEFSVPPKRNSHTGRRVNVFLGGTDPQGGTVLAIEAIAPLCGKTLQVDVIAGGANPHLNAIKAMCNSLPAITLHVQSNDIATLFASADLGIGAGGSATLERCNRGLPQILTSFADNQRPSCAAFARAGAALDVGDMKSLSAADLRAAITSLLENSQRLQDMRGIGRALVDGNGTFRVAEKIASIVGVAA